MKTIFLGCTKYSERLLKCILNIRSVEVKAIFSIPEKFSISYSRDKVVNNNYADLRKYSEELNIPFFEIDSLIGKKLKDFEEQIKTIAPDVILVLGWYYKVPKSIRSFAKYGAWGIHASLLPKYAGGAPLVWAIIEGEKQTGVTLFRLDDGMDDGDIISQKTFKIEKEDTIKEVYEKATIASEEILNDILNNPNLINYVPQDRSRIQIFPQRSPADGEIDWNCDSEKIYNFIRAQTKPYPGAWTIINGKKITIWSATVEELNKVNNE